MNDRENEIVQHVLEAYARSCQAEDNSEIALERSQEYVLMTGASSKANLVHKNVGPKVLANKGVLVCVKFESTTTTTDCQLCEAILSAFRQMAEIFIGDDRLSCIKETISAAIGKDERRLLLEFVPEFLLMITESTDDDEGISKATADDDSFKRLQDLLCTICYAVSTIVSLVVFFDGVQWSDPIGLNLVQSFLSEQATLGTNSEPLSKDSRPKLLVVAAMRDEGPDYRDEQVAYDALERARRRALNLNLTRLHVLETGNMGEACNGLITSNLGLILKSTVLSAAHPEYVMDALDQELLDSKNQMKCKKQNIPTIMLHKCQKLEKPIRQRIHKLPAFSLELLQVAACIGDVIDETAICTVMGDKVSRISRALEDAAKEGLVEFMPQRGQYHFACDNVRQTLFSTIVDQNELSFHIGYKLWHQSSPFFLDSNLYTIVDLLNMGIKAMANKEESYKAAELNLVAGGNAVTKASFRDASRYFSSGIEFLEVGGDYWKERYELTLSLYNGAADAALLNQNFGEVTDLIAVINLNARSFRDKLAAFATQICAYGLQGMVQEATKVGIDVLRELGEPLPEDPGRIEIRSDLNRTARTLCGKSIDDITSLAYMTDEKKVNAMHFLTTMIPYAYEAGSPYSDWIAARAVRLTLTHGLTKGCAPAFSSYARVLGRFNPKLGHQYGKLAIKLSEKLHAKELMPRVQVSFYTFTSHWTRPVKESLEPLDNAVDVAFRNGDFEYALIGSYFRALLSVYAGMELVQLERLLIGTRQRISVHKARILFQATGVILQFVHNLTGRAKDPKVLDGEAFQQCDNAVTGPWLLSSEFVGFSSELAYIFGDFGLAEQFADKLEGFGSRVPFASFSFAAFQYRMGLIAVARARQGMHPSRNVKKARLCLKKMAGWAKECPDNFLSKQLLLEAELASFKTLHNRSAVDPKVEALYVRATETALQQGFRADAAIACERAGDYILRQQQDESSHGAIYQYWNQAQVIFREWGATAKADELQNCLVTRSGVQLDSP